MADSIIGPVMDLELVPAVADPAPVPGLAQDFIPLLLPLGGLQVLLIGAGALYRKPDDVVRVLGVGLGLSVELAEHVQLPELRLAGDRQESDVTTIVTFQLPPPRWRDSPRCTLVGSTTR
jgi:hypothetical protein